MNGSKNRIRFMRIVLHLIIVLFILSAPISLNAYILDLSKFDYILDAKNNKLFSVKNTANAYRAVYYSDEDYYRYVSFYNSYETKKNNDKIMKLKKLKEFINYSLQKWF
jgi:hypothetical protein